MANFVVLGSWTAQGAKAYAETVDRSEKAAALMAGMGARMVGIWWTLGKYDFVTVMEAPDDATATAALLKLGAQGNIHTVTMRAFDPAEMKEVVAKAAR